MIKEFNHTAIIAGEHNVSYKELLQRITLFARHTPREKGVRTIILSENREGWVYAFFAVWLNRGIAVPVDATSTVEDIAYILRDCQPSCIWTSSDKQEAVIAAVREAGSEATVMLIDDYEHSDVQGIENAEISYNMDDTALIIYTSGTTGSPKGVMLSYTNLFANIKGVSEEVPIFNTERRTIILLPLHHVLPLMGTLIAPILNGAGVAICPSMTAADIMDTLCRGKVGIFVGVPRLWQTLYAGIKKKIDANFATRTLFNICAKAHSRTLSRLVFKSVRDKMGGHIDFCVSGGAALDKEIGEGLRTLGLDVLEGYGMTETAPIISFTRPGDIIPGCVGLPLPSVECKLINGELCCKGPNVMQGYYGRPEETAAVIDKDGFLHTGDLARFDDKGRIIITGRTKEIIVLSNGKNVQPNEIEYKLEKYDTRVKEAAVMQDGDMLRAIIVPQEQWAAELSDQDVERDLKREVLEPYNRTVENYKKIMNIFVYRGELPRTKLDKIQRFKLKDIIAGNSAVQPAAELPAADEPTFEEYKIIKKYIEEEKKLPVHADAHLETDLAFDSLDKVGLQSFIEQAFGVEVNADSMAGFTDVHALARHVADYKTRMEVEHNDWHTILAESKVKLPLPTASFTYPLMAKVSKMLLRFHNRLTVKGKENIPAKGPFILAPNHQSFIDGPLVMAGVEWGMVSNCYFYATEEHVQGSVLRFLASHHNIILMEKHNLKNSILKLAEVLRQGKNIVIFPEGTRSRNGKTTDFKKTFAILSMELGVPVVPVCIKGAFESLPRGRRVPLPTKIELEYLPHISPADYRTYDEMAVATRRAIDQKLK